MFSNYTHFFCQTSYFFETYWERFSHYIEKCFRQVFFICFISQWMKRWKHRLFVFPSKKTLIWRRNCSIGQSRCSMTSKRRIGWFLERSLGIKFFQPRVRLTNQKPRAFVSIQQTNQIALFPLVCCFFFCIVREFSFHVTRKSFFVYTGFSPYHSDHRFFFFFLILVSGT